MNTRPNLVIYRDHLLHPSETFIKAQGEDLQNFMPYYAGSRIVSGIELPKERVLALNNGSLTGLLRETLFKLLGLEFGLVRRLRKLRPLLIHAHFGSDGVLALPLAHRLKVPLIVTFHGFDATVKDQYAKSSFFTHRLYVRKKRVLQRRANLFIAVSDFVKGKMIEQGFNRDHIVRHYIGIDVERFKADPDIQRLPIVLFAGRLVENKGCAYLIQAMGKVQQALPWVELVVIGDGPLRGDLMEMAARTLQNYRFLGLQTQAEVVYWMNRAKVFSVPSITIRSGDSEAFGMVFAEAGAMGLPVVSFTTGGITEAVAHGETGFLVPEKDWQGLAYHIQQLFENDLLWQKLCANGQARVRRLFDLKSQTRQLEDIYKDAIYAFHRSNVERLNEAVKNFESS